MAELRFPVEIDDSKAQKELEKFVTKIDKLKQSIEKTETVRAPIVDQLKEAQTAADETAKKVEDLKAALEIEKIKVEYAKDNGGIKASEWFESQTKQKQISAELAEQERILQAQSAEKNKLQIKDEELLSTLEEQTSELNSAQTHAGELTRQISEAKDAQKLNAVFSGVKTTIAGSVKGILQYGLGIRSLYILFRKLKQYTIEAVKAYADNDPETKEKINELKTALSELKGSWGAAFAPIVNAVTPLLKTLVSWLTTAANAITAFFAALAGKGSYKKAVASTGELSSNLGGAADNAKEAKKELMGIDELNVMSDNNTGGSGGSGSSDLGYKYEDVPIDMNSFTGQLALTVRDVLFDWSDLTPEQIAEKCFAAIPTIAGMVVGGTVGGLPGVIIGGLVGLTLGILADNIIFNHDGELSTSEILDMVLSVLLMMGFAAIGISLGGGAVGAALGAEIGLGLSLLVKDVDVEAMASWNSMNLFEKFLTFLGGIVGGLIAFSLGTGVAGAALGAAIGIELMLWVKGLDLSDVGWLQDVKRWLWDDGILAILNELNYLIIQPIKSVCYKIVSKFNDLKSRLSNIVKNIKSLFHFEFHMPTLRLPHIQVTWQDAGAIAQFFGISQLPHLSVAWYAKGGIVDGATLIGAGEQGKEAIVPLERNTQWVNMVARELADMLFDRDIFTEIADRISTIPTALDRMTAQLADIGNIPMPAVAMGTVVPPNATSGGYAYSALESKIDALLDRLDGLSGGGGKIEPSDIYLDKRKVGEVTYEYIQERERGRGK